MHHSIESSSKAEKSSKSDIHSLPKELLCETVMDLPSELSELSCGHIGIESLPDEMCLDDKLSHDKYDLYHDMSDVSSIDHLQIENAVGEVGQRFYDLESMKGALNKSIGEINELKPPNSPVLSTWFDNGGSIKFFEKDNKSVWTYTDSLGREVEYVNGYPVFPKEAKHPVIEDIDIGKFTGDRNLDKAIYRQKLQELYGLTEIPDGYVLHHDSKNGILQLIKSDWHKEFTHAGGHSLFKED